MLKKQQGPQKESDPLSQGSEFTRQVQAFSHAAAELLSPLGISTFGADVQVITNPRDWSQTPAMTLLVTRDQNSGSFFADDYSSRADIIYGLNLPALANTAGIKPGYIDLFILPDPAKPVKIYTEEAPRFQSPDTTVISLDQAVERGFFDQHALYHDLCRTYGLSDVAVENGHIVSPDPFSADSLELLLEAGFTDMLQAQGILEIGGGVSPVAQRALQRGIPVTIVDNAPDVMARFRKQYGQYIASGQLTLIQRDVRDFLEEPSARLGESHTYGWVNIGVPYELGPILMQQYGDTISQMAEIFTIQSGIPGIGEMEHAILAGDTRFTAAAWWSDQMPVGKHFSHTTAVLNREFQYGIIATHRDEDFKTLVHFLSQNPQWEDPNAHRQHVQL